MAIQCTHCGTVLKENARFCNICGTLVPSHPLNPQSNVSPSPVAEQSNNSEGSMRDEATQRPPARPTRRTLPDEPPAWMNQLENGVRANVLSNSVRDRQQPLPQPAGSGSNVPQLDFPAQGPELQTSSPARELRVKVWEQGQPGSKTEQDTRTQVNQKQPPVEDDEVEDLPTRPLVAEAPRMVKPKSPINTPAQKGQAALSDNVDQLDTVPMVTHRGVKPHTMSRSGVDEQQRQTWQQQDDPHGRTTVRQKPSTTSPPTSSHPHRTTGSFDQDYQVAPSAISMHNLRQTPPPLVVVDSTRQPEKRKSRKTMTIVLLVLLLLLVGGGIATWLVLYQPFTVAGVTQPQQTFSNAQIGVSLQYPRGWIARVEAQKSTVHLADSSQTARFSIVFTPTSGGDVNKYLQQEATQLTMTAVKPGAAQTFAGTSWQQLQGKVLVNGATYTETLFATMHQQKVCTIMQLAPQTTYAQEEQYTFSAIRSSFQFVA